MTRKQKAPPVESGSAVVPRETDLLEQNGERGNGKAHLLIPIYEEVLRGIVGASLLTFDHSKWTQGIAKALDLVTFLEVVRGQDLQWYDAGMYLDFSIRSGPDSFWWSGAMRSAEWHGLLKAIPGKRLQFRVIGPSVASNQPDGAESICSIEFDEVCALTAAVDATCIKPSNGVPRTPVDVRRVALGLLYRGLSRADRDETEVLLPQNEPDFIADDPLGDVESAVVDAMCKTGRARRNRSGTWLNVNPMVKSK
jgi:hypothetical protein